MFRLSQNLIDSFALLSLRIRMTRYVKEKLNKKLVSQNFSIPTKHFNF